MGSWPISCAEASCQTKLHAGWPRWGICNDRAFVAYICCVVLISSLLCFAHTTRRIINDYFMAASWEVVANYRPRAFQERSSTALLWPLEFGVIFSVGECMGVRQSDLAVILFAGWNRFSLTLKCLAWMFRRFRRVPSGIDRDSFYHEVK